MYFVSREDEKWRQTRGSSPPLTDDVSLLTPSSRRNPFSLSANSTVAATLLHERTHKIPEQGMHAVCDNSTMTPKSRAEIFASSSPLFFFVGCVCMFSSAAGDDDDGSSFRVSRPKNRLFPRVL